MSEQIVTAMLSGLVALLVAAVGAALTLAQQRRERAGWLSDLKSGWALELHKARLESYPEVFRILGGLSHAAGSALTPEAAGQVAVALNGWFYGPGGMCATATARGAVLGLRHCCRRWARDGGRQPDDLYRWRNLTIAALRSDLDLAGRESYDFRPGSTILADLRRELESAERGARPGGAGRTSGRFTLRRPGRGGAAPTGRAAGRPARGLVAPPADDH
ncbi:hypothetical protein [Kitasatospora purpeofusca]|uniref:hypothetical protein n=1 Tax=Kitasatospora purpeofusca TaxID=67352 RepID=UPI000A83EB9F|nr:hypothetical protein [Kitasatospora purpeofusca]MCX4759075.1 hypothetical protein [Kitasatospora purpeofusca]WSR30510.1 hypothetical protein OG715_05785 [Kitasatospora purpeofusca]WSR38749.1 hypothetical protein OG196_06420 [Kitasatospora purpeofusca]